MSINEVSEYNPWQVIHVFLAALALLSIPLVFSLPWFEWSRPEGQSGRGWYCEPGNVSTHDVEGLIFFLPSADCLGCGCMVKFLPIDEQDYLIATYIGWLARALALISIATNLWIATNGFFPDESILPAKCLSCLLLPALLCVMCVIGCNLFYSWGEDITVSFASDELRTWRLMRIDWRGPAVLLFALHPTIAQMVTIIKRKFSKSWFCMYAKHTPADHAARVWPKP